MHYWFEKSVQGNVMNVFHILRSVCYADLDKETESYTFHGS